MKRFEFLLVSIAVFIMGVGGYAFSTEELTKRALIAIYLNPGTCNQKIPASYGNEDCREDNLNSTTFTASNWSTTAGSPQLGSGSYLRGLFYDNADYSTVTAVLSDVYAYYVANGTLPADGQDVITNGKHITIRRSNAAR